MSQSFSIKHGSPMDRGSADRYYGRAYKPHWWLIHEDKSITRIEKDKMNDAEIEQYKKGFDTEENRKDWG